MSEGSLPAWLHRRRKPHPRQRGHRGGGLRRPPVLRRRLGVSAVTRERASIADHYGVMMVNGGVALFIAALIASNRLALWTALHRLFAG